MEAIRELVDQYSINLTAATYAIAVIVAIPILWKKKEYLNIKHPWEAVLYSLLLSVCYFAGVVLFYNVERIISGNSLGMGLSIMGVYLIGGPLAWIIALLLRKDRRHFLDAYTFFLLPGCFLARYRCIIANCCMGSRIFNTQWRWPVREIELAYYLFMLWVIWKRSKDRSTTGQQFPLVMMWYGIFRFINEWFRTSPSTSMVHGSHVWALICVVVGGGIYMELRSKQMEQKKQVKVTRRT